MKRLFTMIILLLLAVLLISCQQVSDARGDFCEALEGVGAQAVKFKTAKVDDPVDTFRTEIESLQQKKKTLDRLAKLTDVPALNKLSTAVDTLAQSVNQVSGNTLGPAAETINAAGTQLETAYLELDNAVCAAK